MCFPIMLSYKIMPVFESLSRAIDFIALLIPRYNSKSMKWQTSISCLSVNFLLRFYTCHLFANTYDGYWYLHVYCRTLLIANAGDCRAVLSRCGTAIEMSVDHRPCSLSEKLRVESLGGYVDDGYLNGLLGVTRALGDWHLEGMKEAGNPGGPLSAEPELKMITLTKDDEFLIIGSDGIWDVFSNQNVVDFARRRLQEHNDVKSCCREIVEEAIKRGATDNLTAVLVSFHLEAPPQVRVSRPGRVARSISAEGLNSLRTLLRNQWWPSSLHSCCNFSSMLHCRVLIVCSDLGTSLLLDVTTIVVMTPAIILVGN